MLASRCRGRSPRQRWQEWIQEQEQVQLPLSPQQRCRRLLRLRLASTMQQSKVPDEAALDQLGQEREW